MRKRRIPPSAVAAFGLLGACCSAGPTYRFDPSFPAAGTPFSQASWVTFEPATRQILVLQRSQPPVTFWSPSGQPLSQWTTKELGFPHSLTLRPEPVGPPSVWITDMAPPLLAGVGFGHCVKHFTLTGELVSTIGTCGENSQGTGLDPVQFDKVTDVAFGQNGLVFVTDGDMGGLNNRTLTLDTASHVLADWSAPNDQPGTGPKQFDLPHVVEVDDCGRVWVVDMLNSRVQVITAEGDFLGQMACWGTTQTHDLALVRRSPTTVRAWITTGLPTPDAPSGTVSLYDLTSTCDRLVLDCGALVGSFEVEYPTSATATVMVHAIAVDPVTEDIYLALLGGNLPPQKWVRTGE